jgi:hypothetical protein
MNNAFDQEILNFNERPASTDLNTAQSRLNQSFREYLQRVFSKRNSIVDPSSVPPPTAAFLADGFRIRPTTPAAFTVLLKAGLGFFYNASDVPAAIGGIVGVDDLQAYKPLSLTADETVAIDAAPGVGQERYDIIEVTYDRRLQDAANRDVFNAGTGAFTSTSVNKTLAWNQNGRHGRVVSPANSTSSIGYKVGVAATVGTAAVPSASPGYVIIARVHVTNATVSVTDTNIVDQRAQLLPGNVGAFTAQVSISTTGGGPNLPTVNQLIAPPGLNVVFVGDSVDIGRAAMFVYLLGGPITQLIPGGDTGNFVSPTGPTKEQLSFSPPVFGNLTATDLARISGAASSNPTNGDIGSGAVLGAPFAMFRIRDDPDTAATLANPTVLFINGAYSY